MISETREFGARAEGGFLIRTPDADDIVNLRRYRWADVAELFPGHERTIQQWIQRGVLGPLSEPGSGGRRRYSLADLVRIETILHLQPYGITPQRGAGISLKLIPRLWSLAEARSALPLSVIVLPRETENEHYAPTASYVPPDMEIFFPADQPLNPPLPGCLVIPADTIIYSVVSRLGEGDIFTADHVVVRP